MTFDALLTTHAPRALAAATGYLGDEQEAREATQEALLKAVRARARYDHQRPFYPWLRRIVRNTCFDRIDRRKRAAVPGLREEWVPSDQPSVLDELHRSEAIASVRRGMGRVSPEHREVLVLRHFEDLSYAEIGVELDLPQGTVMSRLYRARKALVRALQELP